MNGASVIAHNVAAQYTYDRIQSNKQKQNKTIQKLSSGYKINKAGDDAAGLAISESMRNKLNGLDQGENNIKDGIGIIQTAEGALTEVHSMLKRMTTLATESANGTFTDDVRKDIEAEVQQLKKEINRIAESTEYNGVYPLNNPLSNVSGVRKVSSAVETDSEKSYWYQMASKFVYVSKTEDAAKNFYSKSQHMFSVNGDTLVLDGKYKAKLNSSDFSTINFVDDQHDEDNEEANDPHAKAFFCIDNSGNINPKGTQHQGGVYTSAIIGPDIPSGRRDDDTTIFLYNDDRTECVALVAMAIRIANKEGYVNNGYAEFPTEDFLSAMNGRTFESLYGNDNQLDAVNGYCKIEAVDMSTTLKEGRTEKAKQKMEAMLQTIGTEKPYISMVHYNYDSARIDPDSLTDASSIVDTKYILHGVLPNQDGDISENGLYPGDIWIQQSANSAWDGLAISTVDATTGGIGIDGISVGTLKDANAAITTINDGVNKVSEYRAMFGATQNRLEHMLNSNRVTSENVTAAESRIRDTDMAKEVAEMTKENILQQAGQSILQQSINQPNQVLQMLQ